MNHSAKYICSNCISDKFLSKEIEDDGHPNDCTSCEDMDSACWPLEQLAERVKVVFDSNYTLTSSEPDAWQYALMRDKESNYVWERAGDSVISIVEDLTGLSEEIAGDLIDFWDDGSYHDYTNPHDQSSYGPEARYISSRPVHDDIELRWKRIQEDLLHRSRFFSHSIASFLDDLFTGVQDLKSFDGPVIETHSPVDFQGLFRARIAYDDDEVRRIIEGLPDQLGPLRGRAVSAGRMNAAGVTVMYGALQEATCIAELRAPVGSIVVTGKFNLLRPIRILNLRRLERCYGQVSLFDPDVQKSSDRMAFLRSLSARLSVPVFSHTAHLDYLSTQCIAEYISAMEPQIDGVAFASAQAGKKATNLVLYDHACRVEPFPYPAGTTTELIPAYDEDGERDGHTLILSVSESSANELTKNTDSGISDFLSTNDEDAKISAPTATLSLDIRSIRVHQVKAVEYHYKSSGVSVFEQPIAKNP